MTIQDSLFQTNNWLEAEKEKLKFAKKYNHPTKLMLAPPSRKFEPKESKEPRRFGVSPRSKNIERLSPGKGRFSAPSPNKWIRDESTYCDIH